MKKQPEPAPRMAKAQPAPPPMPLPQVLAQAMQQSPLATPPGYQSPIPPREPSARPNMGPPARFDEWGERRQDAYAQKQAGNSPMTGGGNLVNFQNPISVGGPSPMTGGGPSLPTPTPIMGGPDPRPMSPPVMAGPTPPPFGAGGSVQGQLGQSLGSQVMANPEPFMRPPPGATIPTPTPINGSFNSSARPPSIGQSLAGSVPLQQGALGATTRPALAGSKGPTPLIGAPGPHRLFGKGVR